MGTARRLSSRGLQVTTCSLCRPPAGWGLPWRPVSCEAQAALSLFAFLKIHSLVFRERGGREEERENCRCERRRLAASLQPGRGPDRESEQRPLALREVPRPLRPPGRARVPGPGFRLGGRHRTGLSRRLRAGLSPSCWVAECRPGPARPVAVSSGLFPQQWDPSDLECVSKETELMVGFWDHWSSCLSVESGQHPGGCAGGGVWPRALRPPPALCSPPQGCCVGPAGRASAAWPRCLPGQRVQGRLSTTTSALAARAGPTATVLPVHVGVCSQSQTGGRGSETVTI